MAEENFKIGDKVKLKNPDSWGRGQGNIIWIVEKMSPGHLYVCRVNGELEETCIVRIVRIEEMKHLYEKGQQLLFLFMSEN